MSEPAVDVATHGARGGRRALAGVSVVLPCQNDEGTVAGAVRNALSAAARAADDHEVIVVDDGSADATLAIASGLARHDLRVRVLVHPNNRGYGAAVRTGIQAARMPWVLLADADLRFDLREVDDLLALAPEADLIVGWRLVHRDGLAGRLAAPRSRLLRGLRRMPARDVDCAFKLARRDLLERLPLSSDGGRVGAELVARAAAVGARLREVGVRPPAAVRP